MTETDDELIALCDAATPGPWEAWDSIYVGMKAAIVAPGLDPLVTVAEVRTNYDDAKFLAAASPERVKALVMRVRELEGLLRPFAEAWTNYGRHAEAEQSDSEAQNIYGVMWDVIDSEKAFPRAAAYFKPAGEGE